MNFLISFNTSCILLRVWMLPYLAPVGPSLIGVIKKSKRTAIILYRLPYSTSRYYSIGHFTFTNTPSPRIPTLLKMALIHGQLANKWIVVCIILFTYVCNSRLCILRWGKWCYKDKKLSFQVKPSSQSKLVLQNCSACSVPFRVFRDI